MLPYLIPIDVLSFYFRHIHRLLKEHQDKGLVCVTIYCIVRLLYKIVKASKIKHKCVQRQKVSKQKYEDLQRKLESLEQPLDVTATKLSFQDLCQVQSQSHGTNHVLLAFQFRAMATDKFTNSVVELIQEESSKEEKNEKFNYMPNSTKKSDAKPLLLNIPVSLSEVIHIQNLEATAGLSSFLQLKASEDAVVVQGRGEIQFELLKLQGAIPFIRTNVPQTAYIIFGSSNPIFGVTKNPLRQERSPGGTSSGEAVLVCTRGSVLGVGTDIAGGLRIPAHFCGVCGFKPTSGRISHKGVTIPVEGQEIVAMCIGPLSNEVAGLVAFMRSVCVPLQHQLDPTVNKMTFDQQMFKSTQPLCVGFFIDDSHTKCVPSIRRSVLEAKMMLEASGYTVVPFQPPDLLHMLTKLYLPVMLGDHFTTLIRYLFPMLFDGCGLGGLTERLCITRTNVQPDPVNASILAVKCPQSVLFWWRKIKEIKAWRQQFISLMIKENIDALLCPVLPFAAVKLGSEESLIGCLTYCALFNLLDFPAGTVPISVVTAEDIEDLKIPEKYTAVTSLEKKIMVDQMGHENKPESSSQDLPVGVQVASLPFQDELVLRILTDLENCRKKH